MQDDKGPLVRLTFLPVAVRAVMEELVEDDICILNHEKADNAHKRDSDIPVPSYTGDESVASHFALVTAYEDIKKRLKETEKENSFLKKKVRILEEKVYLITASSMKYKVAVLNTDVGWLAFDAVILKLIKSLNCTQANWELEKLNSDLKVHSLEQDLEKLKEECNSLRKELQNSKKDQTQYENPLHGDHLQRQDLQSVQQMYWDLKREMSNLRVVTDKQAEFLRKLKRSPPGAKKGKSVFAVTDLTNTNH
ncbi:5-azacytidine induced 2 [Turdus rufiventris]|nr:5-azacytidine induced 2 [Turdus rufiventris]